jgi:hypothetical protein
MLGPLSQALAMPSQIVLEIQRKENAEKLWQNDAEALLKKVEPDLELRFEWNKANENQARFVCEKAGQGHVQVAHFEIGGSDQSGSLYYLLQHMGFSFPHPRMTISPSAKQLKASCGQSVVFTPAFAKRGFHVHLQHPNEWVSAFMMGETQIAHDLILWLVRNGQNVLQVQMIKPGPTGQGLAIHNILTEARAYGLYVVMNFSLASQQQKSYSLLPLWSVLTGFRAEELLKSKIEYLLENYPMDAMGIELGTSEFTKTSPAKTLAWLEAARGVLASRGVALFTKAHVSVGQSDLHYGNYNFLAQHAQPGVGVQVHTVMWYGLESRQAPVYGRKDFSDVRDFMLAQKSLRPVWYFPETSYWVGMDIDVPLFLTDYLSERALDLDFCQRNEIPGVVDFTTGQELGYWLMDWTQALMSLEKTSVHNPLMGLERLGEDLDWWKFYLEYQSYYFTQAQLIQVLTAHNLMDDLAFYFSFLHPLHERALVTGQTLALLQEAVNNYPDAAGVHDEELRAMVHVTGLRLRHVLSVQRALAISAAPGGELQRTQALAEAAQIRQEALAVMQGLQRNFSRYPESFVFSRASNPTSYAYGYGWPAASLHFWEREELMAAGNSHNPFFMNIYDPISLLF